MRALLVDDSRTDRQLICKLLESSDLSVDVTEVPDATAAMNVLTTETFDCLLVDQRMPGIAGTEFIRSFRDRETDQRTRILVLSGENSNTLTIEEAVGAGGDFFMAKQDLTASRLKAVLRCLGPGG